MLEIELKYTVPDRDTAEIIWQDPCLTDMEEPGSREKLAFKSVYFDTACGSLAKNDIAFRVRLEGARVIATLKYNGKSSGPLHTREEINVPIDDKACLISPDPAIFHESDIGKEITGLIADKPLINVMEVGFIRRRVRVDTGNSIIEASIDIGEIKTDSGSLPVCELELELFSGAQDDLINLGNKLAERYALIPEEKSKYARGLALAGRVPVFTQSTD